MFQGLDLQREKREYVEKLAFIWGQHRLIHGSEMEFFGLGACLGAA